MVNMIAGLLLLYLVLAGIKYFARLSPSAAARLVRNGGGLLGLIGALLLMLRGSVSLASLLAGAAFRLAGWGRIASFGAFNPGGARPSSRRRSSVRSAMIEMQLDHASGEMAGRVLAGVYVGRPLETLARPDCVGLYATLLRDDPDGARLLETYLDRRFAGWREAAQGESDARNERVGRAGAMTEQEAYEVLGLSPGASAEDIARAHRMLMKKIHPDHGGTTSLAARVNQAKDILSRRH